MARPKPSFPDTPDRRTISLRMKTAAAADTYIAHPDHKNEFIYDFSGFAERAFTEFLNRHHPGLIEEQEKALMREPVTLRVAEETRAAYFTAKKQPPPATRRQPKKGGASDKSG